MDSETTTLARKVKVGPVALKKYDSTNSNNEREESLYIVEKNSRNISQTLIQHSYVLTITFLCSDYYGIRPSRHLTSRKNKHILYGRLSDDLGKNKYLQVSLTNWRISNFSKIRHWE